MDRRTFLRAALSSTVVLCSPGAVLCAGAEKKVALNFDDGPEPLVLTRLLPLLAEHRVPATFFVIGENAARLLPTLSEVHVRGHEIENHGWQHVKFTKLFAEKGRGAVADSLRKTADVIQKASGRLPRFFRPPFWDSSSDLRTVLHALGYRVMTIGDPDINTLDYDDVAHKRSPQVLTERLRGALDARAKGGATSFVPVLHERHLTVEALSVLIPQLQRAGYVFVRLDALL